MPVPSFKPGPCWAADGRERAWRRLLEHEVTRAASHLLLALPSCPHSTGGVAPPLLGSLDSLLSSLVAGGAATVPPHNTDQMFDSSLYKRCMGKAALPKTHAAVAYPGRTAACWHAWAVNNKQLPQAVYAEHFNHRSLLLLPVSIGCPLLLLCRRARIIHGPALPTRLPPRFRCCPPLLPNRRTRLPLPPPPPPPTRPPPLHPTLRRPSCC